MATHAQNGTISRQLEALASAVEDLARQGGESAVAIAEKGRELLGMARELAGSIAQRTAEEVTDRAGSTYRQVRDTAQYEVEVAREAVREHPLLAVAGVAAVSAIVAVVVTTAVQRHRH